MMCERRRRFAGFLFIISGLTVLAVGQSSAQNYHATTTYKLPGNGIHQYVSIDHAARRLYVPHGPEVQVIDIDSGKLVGSIPDSKNALSVALAPELKRGFTMDNEDGRLLIFDTVSLAMIRSVTAQGTDFLFYDPETQRVFSTSSPIWVIDARTGDGVGTANVQDEIRVGVSNGKGHIYLLVDSIQGRIVVLNSHTLSTEGTYTMPSCLDPHSMAYDETGGKLLVACGNGLRVAINESSGKETSVTRMCSGEGSTAVDADDKLVFVSCSEGVMSVIKQITPDHYELFDTVKTRLGSRTMAFDVQTKRLFLPTVEYDLMDRTPLAEPLAPVRRAKENSFAILVMSP